MAGAGSRALIPRAELPIPSRRRSEPASQQTPLCGEETPKVAVGHRPHAWLLSVRAYLRLFLLKYRVREEAVTPPVLTQS